MLLNNFFFIDKLLHVKNSITADIHIEASHDILNGHFPQQPVVPGVCMLEMQKEVLQQALQKPLFMASASMVKFLTMFTPDQMTQAQFQIQYLETESGIQVTSSLVHGERVFLKCKGVYTVRS
jgi:3-hydroxyacyl-[acyl-carrier-protein] dehydratase